MSIHKQILYSNKAGRPGKTISAIILCLIFGSSLWAQTNSSPKDNYRDKASKESAYATLYDNGYVILRDGTRLSGEISLQGSSFESVHIIKIRTNSGEKYNFYPTSLSEYGLDNSTVNETPNKFSWTVVAERNPTVDPDEGQSLTSLLPKKDKRIGTAEYGYANLMDGQKIEGRITLTEVNGRLESIELKKPKEKKVKLDPAEVKTYGAQLLEDSEETKFKSPWSLVSWKPSNASGALVNIKSYPMPGYVVMNNGNRQSGYITLVKKEGSAAIRQVWVSARSDGKQPNKITYGDIQSYGVNLSIDLYYETLKKKGTPFDELDPKYKLHPGRVTMVDEEIKEGLIAPASIDNDFTDIYFAADENSSLELFSAADIEEFEQNIPESELKDYERMIYNKHHIMGYNKQIPPQWQYDYTGNGMSETVFQPGYLIFKTGDKKIGSISVFTSGMGTKVTLKESGQKKVKYSAKEYAEYGLIVQEPSTAFPEKLFNSRKGNNGFVQLLGSENRIQGHLEITQDWEKATNVSNQGEKTKTDYAVRVFVIKKDGKKEEYPENQVDIYGLTDVPVRKLTSDGVVIYDDPKQNFHPGSFTYQGSTINGFIAYAPPNDAGEYDAFFYAAEKDGVANVYYTSKGSSSVNQTIAQEIEEYNPLDDSFLKAMTIDKEVKNNGYVITADGNRIDGALQMSFPPNLWFATDVVLTQADGTVSNHNTGDGSLKRIVVTLEGEEREFVSFGRGYAEVLQREGNLVHFRNPSPTTPSFGGGLLNQFVGAAAEAGAQELEEKIAEERMKKMAKDGWTVREIQTANQEDPVTFEVTDDFVKIYAKEHIVMDTESDRATMYVPGNYYREMEAELMGCIEYLNLDKNGQTGLRKMRNPVETMRFLNSCMAQ